MASGTETAGIVLETPRLLLRRLLPSDLGALYALYRDPEVRRHFPDGTRTLAQTREELDWFLQGHPAFPALGLWATIEKRSGAFIGRCGLLPWQLDGVAEVEVAFLIDKRRWREGFATEAGRGIVRHARERLGLQRLVCLIMPGNLASVGVARRLGMAFERSHCDEFGPCHVYATAAMSTNGC